MASIRLMRKWSVPVATAIAVPIFTPVVLADSDKKKDAGGATSRVIRPSDLPIYEEPDEVLDFEYQGHERTSLEDNVGVVRKKVEGVLEATRSTREKIVYVCETGKAHTMATIDYITDEDNVLPRAGAITVGGLAGLVLGTKKKGGILRKILYTSAGATGAASLCYPRHAYQLSQKAIEGVKDTGTIGYNFVAGVKPTSKVPVPPQPPKKEDPPKPKKEEPPVAEEVPTEAPPSTPDQAPTESEPESAESGAAEVKQEGKDTIVQLAPPAPAPVEKDYGQSNPEDSDMYTTRG